MENEDITPHVKEVARVLGNKVEESKIAEEMETYLKVYRVSMETAKRSIVKNFGGDPNALSRGGVRKKVAELEPLGRERRSAGQGHVRHSQGSGDGQRQETDRLRNAGRRVRSGAVHPLGHGKGLPQDRRGLPAAQRLHQGVRGQGAGEPGQPGLGGDAQSG